MMTINSHMQFCHSHEKLEVMMIMTTIIPDLPKPVLYACACTCIRMHISYIHINVYMCVCKAGNLHRPQGLSNSEMHAAAQQGGVFSAWRDPRAEYPSFLQAKKLQDLTSQLEISAASKGCTHGQWTLLGVWSRTGPLLQDSFGQDQGECRPKLYCRLEVSHGNERCSTSLREEVPQQGAKMCEPPCTIRMQEAFMESICQAKNIITSIAGQGPRAQANGAET